MRKFFALALMIVALGSCGEDIEFNNKSVVQGDKDNVFWKGGDATAVVTGNKITITTSTLTETLTLEFKVPAAPADPKNASTFATYALGINGLYKATFTTTNEAGDVTAYDTGTSSTDEGDGEIIVKEFGQGFISGTFRFNALNIDPESEANEIVNFQNGVFYKLPLTAAP